MKNLNLNKLKDNKIIKYLFVFSLLFNVIIGLLLFYNLDFSENYNLLFDSDSVRVISLLSTGWFNDSRAHAHPLYLLISKPIINFISGFTIDKIIAMIIFSSLTSTITVVLIYKALSLFHKDNYFKVILSLCYLFTYGNIVFTGSIETYNLSALILVLLWYYTIKKLKDGNFTKYSYIIFALLGLLSLSITITNFIVFLIVIFILLLSRKIKIKYLITIVLSSIVLLFGLNYFQHVVWSNTNPIWQDSLTVEKAYVKKDKINTKLSNIIRDAYFNSIIASKQRVEVTNRIIYHTGSYQLRLTKNNIFNIFLLSIFYITAIVIIVKNYKNNLLINTGLTLTLLFNTCMHLIYGDNYFLYSLHFLYPIFLLIGINASCEKNKNLNKFLLIVMTVMLIVEIFNNGYRYLELFQLARKILPETLFLSQLGFLKTTIFFLSLIFVVTISVYACFFFKKRYLQEKNKDKKYMFIILILVSLFACELTFIYIDSIKVSNKFLWKEFFPQEKTYPITSKIDFLDEKFKDKFSAEIKSLDSYLQEYSNFKNENSHEIRDDIIQDDYYYFGLGNRRKLLYAYDCIKDIKTKKTLYSFNVKELIVIPNEYSLLIQTKEDDFIKIYEDNEGVHYNKNGKDKIINGTNYKINLYDFKNVKYQNMKKVLYGEILFNIKDNNLYDNVIVSNKPILENIDISTLTSEENINKFLKKYNHNIFDENKLILNEQPYPLTWNEKDENSKYKNIDIINEIFVNRKLSPTSSTKAMNLLLLIQK